MRCLIVDSDPKASKLTAKNLQANGIVVELADSGKDGADLGKFYDYDIIIVERDLPDISSLDFIRLIRKSDVKTPILVLASDNAENQNIKSINEGADGYLVKPFAPDELLANLKMIVRRTKGFSESIIKNGRLTIDLIRREVFFDDRSLSITNKEYGILELLFLNTGQVVNIHQFLDHLYGGIDEPEKSSISGFISRLRRKIADAAGDESYIQNIRGVGYKLVEKDNDNLFDSENSPKIPNQKVGIKFTVNIDGFIDYDKSQLPDKTTDEKKILALHPVLVKATTNLIVSFEDGPGHNIFGDLVDDARSYLEAINLPTKDIIFAKVWALGVVLQKTADAASRAIEDRLFPELEDNQKRNLDAVLAIHGPFIQASDVGRELLEEAERFDARPKPINTYVEAIRELTQNLRESHGFIEEKTKRQICSINSRIGEGHYIAREFVTSKTTTANLLIAISTYIVLEASGGAFGGVVGEIAVDSIAGRSIVASGTEGLNQLHHTAVNALQFVAANEDAIRRLAVFSSESFGWARYFVRWIKSKSIELKITDRMQP